MQKMEQPSNMGPKLYYQILAWIFILALMVGVGYLLPVPGTDWVHHWQPRYEIDAYPPWVVWMLFFLPELPFLTGLTLTILLFVLWRRKATLSHYLAAFSAMPLFWTLWLGQIDAVPLLGLAILPWGIPLVLLKPQVAVWFVWVWWRRHPKRVYIALGTAAFLGITLLIWGWWPGQYTEPASFRSAYDLSAWRLHWSLGIVALVGAVIEKDHDRAMALGALAAPYIQGASYIVLLPSMTRLSGWRLVVVWVTTWFAAFVALFGDRIRPISMLFPITLWLLLYLDERMEAIKSKKIQDHRIEDGNNS